MDNPIRVGLASGGVGWVSAWDWGAHLFGVVAREGRLENEQRASQFAVSASLLYFLCEEGNNEGRNDSDVLSVFRFPVFWMFFKMSVNNNDQQPPEPTRGPAPSPHQKHVDDKAEIVRDIPDPVMILSDLCEPVKLFDNGGAITQLSKTCTCEQSDSFDGLSHLRPTINRYPKLLNDPSIYEQGICSSLHRAAREKGEVTMIALIALTVILSSGTTLVLLRLWRQ